MPSGSRPKTESAKARAASPWSTQDERQHRIHLGTQCNSQLTKRAGQLGDSERLASFENRAVWRAKRDPRGRRKGIARVDRTVSRRAPPPNDGEPPPKLREVEAWETKRHSALFRRSGSTQPPLRRPFARKSEFLDGREGRLATSNVFGFHFGCCWFAETRKRLN